MVGSHAATGRDLPNTDSLVVRSRCHPQSSRVDRDGPDASFVTKELDRQTGRERLKVAGRGKLGDQTLRVDVQAVLPDTRRKVKIQATFETLLNELAVSGNVPESVVLLREVVLGAILLVHLVPLLDLLLGWQVFCGRVVTLVVGGQLHLGRSNVHHMLLPGFVIGIVPKVVVLGLGGNVSRLAGNNATLANGTNNLHDSLGLMLRRNETTLRLRSSRQGHNLRLGREELDLILVGVVIGIGDTVALQTTNNLEFIC